MNIRELVKKYRDAAGDWANTLSDIIDLHDRIQQLGEDLLAAIDRLDRKAATAKAECEAWRAAFDPETGRQTGDASDCRDVVSARTATDEAWREIRE